jgi:hypothetical protein
MSTFPKFMDLPLELRLDIYELILPQNEELSFGNVSAHVRPPMTCPAFTHHLGDHLALTQVSRQVRNETTPILYGKNQFEVILRANKVAEAPPMQPPCTRRTAKKSAKWAADCDPVYYLTYGDRHAAAWARVARPQAIRRVRRLLVGVERADLVAEWRHLRRLSLSPSSLSLERTGLFSVQRWHLHAIELKCPVLTTPVWCVDSTGYFAHEKGLAKVDPPKPHRPGVPQVCSRCRLMFNAWRIDVLRARGTTRELFLALVWYGGRESPFCSKNLRLTSIR